LAGAFEAAVVTGEVDCDEALERAATVLVRLGLLTVVDSGPGWSAGTQVPSRTTAVRSSGAVWPAGSGPGASRASSSPPTCPAGCTTVWCFTVLGAGDDLLAEGDAGGAPPL
jgi:hypothetical protein